jgi:hypothetical protein
MRGVETQRARLSSSWEAKLVLVRLRWRTHEGEEVSLGFLMSLQEEKRGKNSPCMRAEVLVMAGTKEML